MAETLSLTVHQCVYVLICECVRKPNKAMNKTEWYEVHERFDRS